MRLSLVVTAGLAGVLILAGGLMLPRQSGFAGYVLKAQRSFQEGMAGAIFDLQSGNTAAFWALIGAAFLYGLVHAAGPGHGKMLLGGAALASRATAWRMTALALASSIAQGGTAIVLVYGGLALFTLSANALVQTADRILMPLSYALIGAIGLFLVWRGLRQMARAGQGQHESGQHGYAHALHGHDHGHAHDHALHGQGEVCDTCGHAHAPSLEQVEAISRPRDVLALIAAVAARPCTGAVMLLVIAWQFGLIWTGILAVLAMALGTALITSAAAWAGVMARNLTLRGAGGWAAPGTGRRVALVFALLQIGAGAVIAALSGAVLVAVIAPGV